MVDIAVDQCHAVCTGNVYGQHSGNYDRHTRSAAVVSIAGDKSIACRRVHERQPDYRFGHTAGGMLLVCGSHYIERINGKDQHRHIAVFGCQCLRSAPGYLCSERFDVYSVTIPIGEMPRNLRENHFLATGIQKRQIDPKRSTYDHFLSATF
jgi:hypothetical protein